MKRSKTTLYLVRHGQTKENLARVFQGHLPGELTDEGLAQARRLAEELKTTAFDRIISSDLERARRTAEILRGDRDIPFETTPLLREINWGSLTGKPIVNLRFFQRPADAETELQLYRRAERFLDEVHRRYEGQTLLVVGHGKINCQINAVIYGLPVERVPSIPKFQNCECRVLKF